MTIRPKSTCPSLQCSSFQSPKYSLTRRPVLEVWRDALPVTWQNFGVVGFFPSYSRTMKDLSALFFSVLSPQVF